MMNPEFLVFGLLTREYLLPATGQPRLDTPGGNLLYSASGLKIWTSGVGLVARVGEDYPREWIEQCTGHGFDTSGIRVVSKKLDLRDFISYSESLEPSTINPITHFARRGMSFPKTLLGYQPLNPKTPSR